MLLNSLNHLLFDRSYNLFLSMLLLDLFCSFHYNYIELPPQFNALQPLEIVLGPSCENAPFRSISLNEASFASSK